VNKNVRAKAPLHALLGCDLYGRVRLTIDSPEVRLPPYTQRWVQSLEHTFKFRLTNKGIEQEGRNYKPVRFLQKLCKTHTFVAPPSALREVCWSGASEEDMPTFWAKFGEHLAAGRKAQVYLSVNPSDLVACSWNVPWSSCLKPDGEYFSGAVGAITDPHSVLIYTGTPEKKVGRQFAYIYAADGPQAYFSRVYGSLPDWMQAAARHYVQRCLAKQAGIPSQWVLGGRQGNYSGNSGAGYLDGDYLRWTRPKDTNPTPVRIDVRTARCLECFEEHESGGNGSCYSCRGDDDYDEDYEDEY
jgi:hypothetical protein